MDIDDFDTQVQSDEYYTDYDYLADEYRNEHGDVSPPIRIDPRDYDPAGDGWGIDDLDEMRLPD